MSSVCRWPLRRCKYSCESCVVCRRVRERMLQKVGSPWPRTWGRATWHPGSLEFASKRYVPQLPRPAYSMQALKAVLTAHAANLPSSISEMQLPVRAFIALPFHLLRCCPIKANLAAQLKRKAMSEMKCCELLASPADQIPCCCYGFDQGCGHELVYG